MTGRYLMKQLNNLSPNQKLLGLVVLVLIIGVIFALYFGDGFLFTLIKVTQPKKITPKIEKVKEVQEVPPPQREYFSNEILIKLKPEAKNRLKIQATPNNTGVARLDQLNKANKVIKMKTVVQVPKGLQKKISSQDKNQDVFRWYKLTLSGNREVIREQPGTMESSGEPETIKGLLSELQTGLKEEKGRKVTAALKFKETISQYRQSSDVEAVELNYIVHTTEEDENFSPTIPNDYYFSSAGVWSQQYDDLWGLKKIQAEWSWSISQGSEEIIVAVIDTGVDYNHEDIASNIWINEGEIPDNNIDDDGNGYIDDVRGWDFINKDNDPMDDSGHGTHVAGTSGAVVNNDPDHSVDSGTGVAGVNWSVKIMPIKFLNDRGAGSVDDGAASIIYAVDNGARIINNSWSLFRGSLIISDAISYAHSEKNAVIVAAASNNSTSASFFAPANDINVITVASSNYLDQLSCFSNYGVKIDVTAPGGDSSGCGGPDDYILSTRSSLNKIKIPDSYTGDDSYLLLRGTSMAAPHVSGLAALILSKYPDYTNEEVRHIMRNTAQSVDGTDSQGFSNSFGHGRINAFAAISKDSPPPVVRIITLPDLLAKGDRLNIEAEMSARYGITYYSLSYGRGESPNDWTLLNESFEPPSSLDVGVFTTNNFQTGYYTIRVLVKDSKGVTSTDFSRIYFDSSLVTGWPRFLKKPFIFNRNYALRGRESSIAFGDIIGDGKVELVATEDCYLDAWKASGETVTGFPVKIDELCHSLGHITLTDLDADGSQEIIVASASTKVHVIKGDGTNFSGWPRDFSDIPWYRLGGCTPGSFSGLFPYSFGASGDIDNACSSPGSDPQKEIIVQTFDFANGAKHCLIGFNHDGSVVANWNSYQTYDGLGSLTIADVVGNRRQDDFILRYTPTYYSTDTFFAADIFTCNGLPVASVPIPRRLYPLGYYGDRIGYNTPAFHFDEDGKREIVIDEGFYYPDAAVYVVEADENGTIHLGWPQDITTGRGSSSSIFYSKGEGGQARIIHNAMDKIWLWDKNGNSISPWPMIKDKLSWEPRSPVVADVTDDGAPEFIIANGFNAYLSSLSVFRQDGTTMVEFPYLFETFSDPIVADFNDDGVAEVAVIGLSEFDILQGTDSSSFGLYVWSIPSSRIVPSATPWSHIYRNAKRVGAYYTCRYDINMDGIVEMTDAKLILSKFGLESGHTGYHNRFDIDNNNTIDMIDVLVFYAILGNPQNSIGCQNLDTLPPVLFLERPHDGASLAGITQISVRVFDMFGIAESGVSFYVDDELIGVDTLSLGPTYKISWDSLSIPDGHHTITVKAVDIAGNEGEISITVMVGNIPDVDSDNDGLLDKQEIELGTDPQNPDTDGDGCQDGAEVNNSPEEGGGRDPLNPWDFYDVPVPALGADGRTDGVKNQVVDMADVLAVLHYAWTETPLSNLQSIDNKYSCIDPTNQTCNSNGICYCDDLNSNGIADGVEYDRTPSPYPDQLWRSGHPNGSIDMGDVSIALTQVFHSCINP